MACFADEMIEHRAAYSATSRPLGGVHRLQLRVAAIKPFEGGDPEELIVEAEAEERNGRIEKGVHVKGMDVLRRAVRVGECEMALEQRADVIGSRVVQRDLPVALSGAVNSGDQARCCAGGRTR